MARKRKKKKTFVDFLSIFLMLAAFCVFVYSGYMLYGYYREYKKGTDEYKALNSTYTVDVESETEDYDALEQEVEASAGDGNTVLDGAQMVSGREVKSIVWDSQSMTVPVMYNPIDFENLQSENSDLIGWIRIRALDISYPVMQAEDNDYYLHRTFEREENIAGSIFLNYDNEPDFSDINSIVYGHNMKNGSMFGTFKNFGDEGVFEKSKYFWIYTRDLIFQYRIFSVAVVENAGLTYQTFYTEDQFNELIEYAFAHSEVDTSGVTVKNGDNIVTLSTCTGDDSTRRVVFGKLMQIYASK